MSLHPQAAAFLKLVARLKTPTLDTLPIDVSRRAAAFGSAPVPNSPKLARIDNRQITRPGGTNLPIRIYVPIGTEPFGVCLYFHGGGWVLNNIDTHDDLVRHLAAKTGCIYVNVDYRLAPEHKYPAAVDDAMTALGWVYEHAAEFGGDSSRIAVAGDSSGGNLAAVACLVNRDRGGPKIAFQALIYPVTDCDFDRDSYLAHAEGFLLTRNEMIWFWNHYVATHEQMYEPYASPLRAPSLSGLPPAYILTAEHDPLRDEGEAYAEALREAGVNVAFRRYEGMIHAFMRRFEQFDTAYTAIQEVADHIRSAFQMSESKDFE